MEELCQNISDLNVTFVLFIYYYIEVNIPILFVDSEYRII